MGAAGRLLKNVVLGLSRDDSWLLWAPQNGQGGRKKGITGPAYPLCLRAACELPGPRGNPRYELNHCTIHWSHVQLDGTLVFWHMKGFLPRGASGYGLFICLAITFSRPCEELGLNYARLLLSAQMTIPDTAVEVTWQSKRLCLEQSKKRMCQIYSKQ